jgi:type IV pilus assembly protein PilC
MPKFSYTAVDPSGRQIQDVIEADSEMAASDAIKSAGYFPTQVTQVAELTEEDVAAAPKKSFTIFGPKGVSGKVLTSFTRQLATLIDAGLPLLRGLSTLAKQEKNPVLRGAIESIATAIESGSTFSDAMAQHPHIFDRLFVSMVKAGEIGGVLEIVLLRLAEFQEKAQRIKSKIVAAMFYPIAVLIIAVVILMFLLVFIVPKFQEIFRDMLGDKPLPALTQFVIAASDIAKNNIILIVGFVAVVVIGYKMYARTEAGTATIDRIKMKMPLMGNLIKLTSISRFTRTLGTLVSSGVPILQALNITKETAGNVVLSEAIVKVHDAVKEGESVVTPLEASGVFPPMVVSMVDIGEEVGRLPDMLMKIADVYEEEVDNAVAGLTSLLEPIMIVFLAVVVGSIVIALFLPLISIITELSNQSG